MSQEETLMPPFRLISLIALAVLTLAASAQSPQGPTLQINKENRTLSVSASDHAEADPDVADIHVGYTAYGPTLQAAYKTASDSSNAIVKAMLNAGAKQSEIQSQNQRVSRLSDYEIKQQKGQRYSVDQSWIVSVDPKIAALILDAAVQAGANQSGEITWRMKNSISLDAEAVHNATERAKAMAAELAKSMGSSLGRPLYATNTVNGNLMFSTGVMNFADMSLGVAGKQAIAAPLSIQTQRVERTANVQIIFAIE
jgi:uncharacterized protein